MKVFYTPKMVAQAGEFSPSPRKPTFVVGAWQEAGIPLDLEEPVPATIAQLSLAHDLEHVKDILSRQKANGFGNFDREVAASLPYTSGAMLAAARWAIQNRSAAAAPCSGFHHASWKRAAAFCTFNGLMVTACTLREEGLARKIAILDCDMHLGNGTIDIIESLEANSWITHLTVHEHYTADPSLLAQLPEFIAGFSDCDVVLYQAGADPHIDDPLGGYLTTEELYERDLIVFRECRRWNLPIAWNLAGGYQSDLDKVIEIHTNTARACQDIYYTPAS